MQGFVEVLYNLFQALLYSSIVYFMVGFASDAGKDATSTSYELFLLHMLGSSLPNRQPLILIHSDNKGCEGNRFC